MQDNFVYAAVAFSIVWIVLFAYSLLLTRQVQELRREVESLQRLRGPEESARATDPTQTKAQGPELLTRREQQGS